MFGSINKTFGCCGKILVAATKISFVVSNFAAVTKPFFSVKEPELCCCVAFLSTAWLRVSSL